MSFISKTLRRLFGQKVEGFAPIEWKAINPIAPAQYQFLIEKRIPTATVTISNPWDKPIRDFRAQIRLQDISDWTSSSYGEVKPKSQATLALILPLLQEKLYSYEEKNASFEIKCSYLDPSGKLREYSDTKIIRILAKDDMIWSLRRGEVEEDLSQLIAAWVTPRDDEVQKLIHESAKNPNAKAVGGLLGYQETQHVSEIKDEFIVPPGTHYPLKLHLRQGSRVSGILNKVIGGAGNDINFALLDPDGMIAFERALAAKSYYQPRGVIKRVRGGYRVNYSASIENDYYLLFDNHFSSISSKNVGISLHIITPITHEEIVSYQIKAIYETIQQNGFVYVSAPISYAPGVSQRVKRPSETIRLKGGNCIDGTVLFASCFEAIALDTFIILLLRTGHSLVAVRIWPSLNKFFILEATIANSATFEESLRIGNQNYEKNKAETKWISISEARKQRIMPLT